MGLKVTCIRELKVKLKAACAPLPIGSTKPALQRFTDFGVVNGASPRIAVTLEGFWSIP